MFESHNHVFDYDIRVVVYEPAGPVRGWLPEPQSIQVSFPADADPALIVELEKNSPGALMLIEPAELAVEVWNERADKWVEPPGARFLALNWTEDFTEEVSIVRFTCPGITYLLEKIKARPGEDDAHLVERADAFEEWLKEEKNELQQRESEYKNAWAPLRSHFKRTGSIYLESYFPKNTSKNRIPHGSVLFHTRVNRPYHFSQATKKWARFNSAGSGGDVIRAAWPKIQTAAYALIAQRKSMPSVAARRDRAVYASRNATRNHRRPLLNSEPTALLARHWKEAQGLGGGRLKGIKRTFQWGYDSTGKRFASKKDREVSIGQSIKSMLNEMVEAGEVSWQTRGRYLDVVPAGALAVDHGTRFSMRLGRDLTEAPDRGTRAHHASSFIISGDENYTSAFSVADPGPWGAWEESFSINGVKTYGQALRATNGHRPELTKQVKLESTRGIVIHARSPRPMIDYLPHHWIMVDATDGFIKQQIRQVTLTRDADGTVSGNLVLGDRFTNRAIDWSRSMSKAASGQDRTVGHTNATQAPLPPATTLGPNTLEVRGGLVLGDDGSPRVDVDLVWAGVVGTPPPEGVEGEDSTEDEVDVD